MDNYVPNQSLINRLLIKLDPEFFSRPREEQDRRRQHFYYKHSDEINTFLYKELFSIEYNPDWGTQDDPLTDQQLHLLNANTTLLCGIGQNSFKLNEFQDDSFDLTSYPSLHEKDLQEFNFQEACMKKHDPESYTYKPYRLYLNHDWARLLDEQKQFHYAILSSLSFYIVGQLYVRDDAAIQELIPYTWEEGEDNGQQVGDGFQWDWKRNANGREAELRELLDRVRDHQIKRLETLNKEFDQADSKIVYLKRTNSECDGPMLEIIVNNSKAAKEIRYEQFLKDCEALQHSFEELDVLVQKEIEKQKQFIESAYQDICESFDPRIIKFKKKNKVIITSDAIDDLEAIAQREDDRDENM